MMWYELTHNPVALFLLVGLLGLIVGSFLNVVIYRLPLMMEREYRVQCAEFLELDPPKLEPKIFNLSFPRSHCPHCNHQITALENIPILSYLWQKGRCSNCAQPISLRYPAVELLCAILSLVVAWKFGASLQLVGALAFTWALIALSMIDIDKQLLPDDITLPFLWLGIFVNLQFGLYTSLENSVIGAMIGYLSLWSVYWGFKLFTGKEGMGHGDFKLLAMLGAWLGWQMLPLIILLSSIVGAVLGSIMIALQKQEQSQPMPFGQFLAAAGWIALIGGKEITHAYLAMTVS